MALTCGDCADYSCDKSGGRLRTDTACTDFFKPWEFESEIEDADGKYPGVLTFQKYGKEMKCIIKYPASDDQHQTETIEFKELDTSTINSISKKVFDLCNVNNPKFVKMSIGAMFEDLQKQHWFPKYKTEGKKSKPEKEEPVKDEDIKEEVPEYIKERAREIAETGNPLDFILRTHQTLHVGDIGYATTLLLSCTNQSALNSEGLQPKGSGASGKGKSHCTKAMAHLIPKEWILTASLSNKAIYYMKDRLKPGMILFCDDVKLSEEMEGIIKRATTFYQTGDTYITIDTNRKDIILRIPARLVWWMTSVDDDQSVQLLNRTFGAEVDESGEQDEAVAQRELELAELGLIGMHENDDVLTCRELIRDIKEHLCSVKIPYARAIKWSDKRNRRNLPIFLDLVRAFTVLRHRQRTVDSEGFLIADLQDFVDAKQLYTSREQAQGTKLTSSERKLCEELKKHGHEMSYQALAEKLGIGETRITQLLMGRKDIVDSGLIYKVTGLHVEKRTEQNTRGGYTSKNYVMLSAGYDPLSFFNEVVSIDRETQTYSTYTTLTPNLQLKNRNGKQELTLLTINDNTECNHTLTFLDYDKSEVATPLQPDCNTLSLPVPQNHCKTVSSYQPIANPKCKAECKTVRAVSSDTETKKCKFDNKTVSSGNSVTSVDHAHRWLDQWKQVHKTSINSHNYRDAATEYATKHKADLEEVLNITCKYAGIPEAFL